MTILSPTALAARFHFLLRPSRPAVTFALRTTAAALAALVLAWALGLENPHWAAMTVWIVAQPTRGMVFAKGLYRLAGTLAGSMVAALIVAQTGGAPLPLALCLAVWVGLCAGGATALRGFRSYGAILAGYSAALVAVIGLTRHEDIALVALMRVAEVALGIVVSAVTTALFVPGSTARDLLVRTRTLSRDTLRWAAAALRHGPDADQIARQHQLLAEIAQINAQADMAAAGSRGLDRRMAQARGLIAALLELMAEVRAHARRPGPDDAELAAALDHAAATLSRTSHADLARWPALAEPLGRAAACYGALAGDADAPEPDSLHVPDPRAALAAALRAFGGVTLSGGVWAATGWPGGSAMMMATAIMCSVFVATDTPSRNVLMAMKGGTLAVPTALAVALLLPQHGLVQAAALVPFMILGGLAIANRATLIPGTDFSMLLLLLSQPGVAHPGTVESLGWTGLGIVCGMGTAALVSRIGSPRDASARADGLADEIVHDLALLAGAAKNKGHRWRGKALHRILRLTLKASEAGNPGRRLEGALAALSVGLSISRLRLLLSGPEEGRAGVAAVLEGCRDLHRDPLAAAARARAEAARQNADTAEILHRLADALMAEADFFRRS